MALKITIETYVETQRDIQTILNMIGANKSKEIDAPDPIVIDHTKPKRGRPAKTTTVKKANTDEVKEKLIQFANENGKPAAIEILEALGAKKFSDLSPDNYDSLIEMIDNYTPESESDDDLEL